ncbi:hypothetical protein LCGC14_0561470 [marine sediment metagenome]|uniref:Uncharacterized protein n=1 Tax=marine sediment metagenome TaxID=412755 RepID=A0A0F9RLV4_9ZZZZ
MSNGSTLRERMARLETLVEALIEHNKVKDRWMLRIVGSLVVGVIMLALPGCIHLFTGTG